MATPRLDALPGYNPEVAVPRVAHPWGNRIAHSEGGMAAVNRVYDHNFNQINRQPHYTNANLIDYERDYKYRRAYSVPPALASGNMNWQDSGPTKDMPTTRFNRNWRPIVGGGHRYMWGMHTNINAARGNQLEGKPRMRPAGQNRLTVQRYRGQSYSQGTQLAGQ